MNTPSLTHKRRVPPRLQQAWHAFTANRPAFYTIGLAGVIHLFLWVTTIVGYFRLPPSIPLHFDAFGQPDRIEPRGQIFVLPLIALMLLLGNGVGGVIVQRWVDDFAAYLLWGGTVVIQVLFWLAVFSLIL
nr:DUF1648 domain-containing protein [Ardenticatena sp.]